MPRKKQGATHERYALALERMAGELEDLGPVAALLEEAHLAGDGRATYALATWYLFGRLYRRNLRTAVRLLRKAAESEVPDALYDLAVCYETGEGAAENPRKAAELYLQAALPARRSRCTKWAAAITTASASSRTGGSRASGSTGPKRWALSTEGGFAWPGFGKLVLRSRPATAARSG
jgi:hypothetical protein